MGGMRTDPVSPTSCGDGMNMQNKLGIEVCEVSKKNNGPRSIGISRGYMSGLLMGVMAMAAEG